MATGVDKRSPRIVAPDLARGIALFGIAWANIATAWAVPPAEYGAQFLGGLGPDATVLDEIAVVGAAMFAHVRGLPMFSTLLGFGVGLIAMSLWRRGYPLSEARKLLLRRYGFLAAIGLVHCVFIFFGDIILLYALLALILIMAIPLKNKTLLIIAAVLYSLHALAMTAMALVGPDFSEMAGSFAGNESETYPSYVLQHIAIAFGYVLAVPISAFSILPLMIVGLVAARVGVHQRVAEFSRWLWGWSLVTLAVILIVGLPWGLASIGVLPTEWASRIDGFNQAFGYLTGPGICAIILLACRPLQKRVESGENLPVPFAMATALGKRSMSGYIAQSVLFFIITMPFTLDYGREVGAFNQALIALGIWAITILGAYALELAGKPGPLEYWHRRLAYGKQGLPERFPAQALPVGAPVAQPQMPPQPEQRPED